MVRSQQVMGWSGRAFVLLSMALCVLWVTGLAMYLLPATDLMEMSELQAVLRRSSGVMHGVTSWALCVMCGRGVWPHVQLMFYRRANIRQWGWGLINLIVLLFLMFSGLLLLYGSPQGREVVSPSHFWMGIAMLLPYALHAGKRMGLRVYSNW